MGTEQSLMIAEQSLVGAVKSVSDGCRTMSIPFFSVLDCVLPLQEKSHLQEFSIFPAF